MTMRSLMGVSAFGLAVTLVTGHAVSAGDAQEPNMTVRLGYLGEAAGDGSYHTRGFSISVGAGSSEFNGITIGNSESVATAVGSEGTELITPNADLPDLNAFQSSICATDENGNCPLLR